MSEPSGEDEKSQDEPLVFMSDASAEGERLMTALRNRGYLVVEVPLALLVGRVSVQRPALILCDVDSPGTLDQIKRLRDVPGGSQMDIVFLGEAGRTLDELRDEVFHEASGFFVRPVDSFGLVRKVEALIGPPARPGTMAPRVLGRPSSRPPSMRAWTPEPAIPPAPPSPSIPSSPLPPSPSIPSSPVPPSPPSPSPPPAAAPSSPSQPISITPSTPSNPAPAPHTSSRPPTRSSMPPRRTSSNPAPELSLPRPIPLGFGAEPEAGASPLARQIPQSEISPELESILARAEQRVGAVSNSGQPPPSLRLSPEAEVEAVLPHDVLAALDEPLDIEEEGEEPEAGTGTGRGTGSGAARTGLGTGGGGTGSGFGTASGGFSTSSGTGGGFGSPITGPGRNFELAVTSPPPRRSTVQATNQSDETGEPPRTPPAIPTRPPEPPSWPAAGGAMTSVESKPVSSRFEAAPLSAMRPTPLPPAPTPEGLRFGQPPSTLDQPTPEPVRQHTGGRAAPMPEIPAVLGKGDAPLAIARAVRSRFSGALAFESEQGIRRIVLRDGDFVTAASSVSSETLVAFLTERGTLAPDVIRTLGHKLPPFGRHAGAALIAYGHLRQDELWPVLRAHAEWIIGRVLSMQSGGASVEREVPARLQAEPAVFGGATGAEVFVEIVRRVVPPGEAIARLGGPKTRFDDGPNAQLLGECALAENELALVNRVKSTTLEETLKSTSSTELAAIIYSLVELAVIEPVGASASNASAQPEPVIYDVLDEQALRARILARRALVDEGDYFALLGLSRAATSYDVQRAYLELRHEFEPSRVLTPTTVDLRDDVDMIIDVLTEAFEILSDQLRRERYRRALEATPR